MKSEQRRLLFLVRSVLIESETALGKIKCGQTAGLKKTLTRLHKEVLQIDGDIVEALDNAQ